MKRLCSVAAFALLTIALHAKTAYIPTYANRIILIENGQVDSLAGHLQMLRMNSKDNLVSCFVAQQTVSAQRIKAIKQAKRTAGWLSALSALSAGGTTFSEVQMLRGGRGPGYIVGYMEGKDLEREFDAMSADAYAQAEEMKTLLADLIVRNNSGKEMLVTDMDRGLVWFILPGQETVLSLAKGEECHFRISSSAPLDENVKYINVCADSSLEKYTVAHETEHFWYIPVSERAKRSLGFDSPADDGYIKIDKETMRMSAVTTSEFKALR